MFSGLFKYASSTRLARLIGFTRGIGILLSVAFAVLKKVLISTQN
jgi:hypothetical protein